MKRFLFFLLLLLAPLSAKGQALYIISSNFPNGTVGVAYTGTIQAGGGTPPYYYYVSGQAPGLNVNPLTGVLSGTPTTAGSYTATYTVNDSVGATINRPYHYTIAPAGPSPVTVSGDLSTLVNTPAVGRTTFLRFTLKNYGSAQPMVAATNALVSLNLCGSDPCVDLYPNNQGVVSGNIWGNDQITPGYMNALPTTFYQVCTYANGNQFRCQNYSLTGASFNYNQASPIVPAPPYQPFAVLINPTAGNQNILQPPGTNITINGNAVPTAIAPINIGGCAIWLTTSTLGSSPCAASSAPTLTPSYVGFGNAGGFLAGNTSFTFNATSGLLSTPGLNSVLYVGGGNSFWPGADIGAQINAAYAALPSSGTIYVVAQSGCENFTTPIILNTPGKYVTLAGTAQANGIASDGACLNFTPISGTAITLDYAPATGGGYSPGSGLRDLTLTNNGCFTNGGCGYSSIGIQIGNTNGGAGASEFHNIKVSGFGTGFAKSNPTSWGQYFDNCSFAWNNVGVSLAGNENDMFTGCRFARNGVGISNNGSEITYMGGSIDSNSTSGVNCTQPVGVVEASFWGVHFENLTQANTHYLTGTCNWQLFGGLMLNDNNTGTTDYFISAQGNNFFIEGTQFQSSGQTVTSVVSLAGGSGVVRGVSAGVNISPSTGIGTIIDTSNAFQLASIADLNTVAGNFNAQTAWKLNGPLAWWEQSTAPPAMSNADVCYGNILNHLLECSYNGGAFIPLTNAFDHTYTSSQTLTSNDSGGLVQMFCTTTCAATLPPSPTIGESFNIVSTGSAVATVNLNGHTWNASGSSPALMDHQTLEIMFDGTNWVGSAPLIAGSGITLTAAGSGLTISSTGGGGGGGSGAFTGGQGPSYQDVGGITPPSNPASGNARLFFNSNTNQMGCVTSSGSGCIVAPTNITAASQYSVAQYTNPGTDVTISGVAAPTTPASVTQILASTPTGGGSAQPWSATLVGVTPSYVSATGISCYTFATTDRGIFKVFTGASSCTATLPLMSTSGFGIGYTFKAYASGAGAVVLTPTSTDQINNASSLTLVSGNWATVTADGAGHWVATPGSAANIANGNQYSIAQYTSSGSGTLLGPVAPPTTPVNVTQILASTPTSGGASTWTTSLTGMLPNYISATGGSCYTLTVTDRSAYDVFTGATSCTVTIPLMSTSGFGAGFAFKAQAYGAGSVILTPTSTDTVNGASSLTLASGNYATLAADGAGNWVASIYAPGASSGTLTNFTAGNLSPLFTSSVANATSTPALTFTLATAGPNTVFGNCTGSTATPNFCTPSGSLSTNNTWTGTNTYNADTFFKSGRPWYDVMAFGAKGDNTTDDTTAIQAALTAACSATSNAGGIVFFPGGNFLVTQPQSPSTSPVFTLCSGLHLLGGNSKAALSPSEPTPPATAINVSNASCGGGENTLPVFQALSASINDVTIENLLINGCNQAIRTSGTQIRLINDGLHAANTGLAFNAAIEVLNSVWTWIEHGSIITTSTTTPTLLMIGDNCSEGGMCANAVGDLFVSDVQFAGGPAQYIQSSSVTGEPAGHWVFRNVFYESGTGDFLTISNSGGAQIGQVGPVTMDDVNVVEPSHTGSAVLAFTSTTGNLQGVEMNHSSGAGTNLIRMTTGTIQGYVVEGCPSECSNSIINGSGAVVGGGGILSAGQSVDIITDTTLNSSSSNKETTVTGAFGQTSGLGPALRITQSGNSFSSLNLDPNGGLVFSSPTQAGWNAQVYQANAPNVSIGFAANFPPTSVAATPSNLGGSLAAGTYYIYMVSTTGSNCTTSSTMSAPSNIAGPYTISGSTGSLAVTWTAAASGMTTALGYCVFTNSSQTYSTSATASAFISGAGATSSTITAFPNSPAAYPITYQMVKAFDFTPNGMIFNNISSPQSSSYPYIPTCMVAATCGSSLSLNPFQADSFARSNSASLGQNWSAITAAGYGTLSINGNAATSGTNAGLSVWSGQPFGNDQFARTTVTVLTNGASDDVGVAVRGTAGSLDTEYLFLCFNGATGIYKRVTGTQTGIATGGPACVVNNVIELDIVGTNLTGLINGAVVLKVSDASITTGSPGVEVWGNDKAQSWVGGNLPGGNGAQSILNQANTWLNVQNFAGNIACNGSYGTAGQLLTSGGASAPCTWTNAGTSTQTISNGTVTMPTTAIPSGQCTSAQTATATGVLSTDNVMADFNGDVTGIVGFAPTTNGILAVFKETLSNQVAFKYCNNTANSITPGAITINWRVVR